MSLKRIVLGCTTIFFLNGVLTHLGMARFQGTVPYVERGMPVLEFYDFFPAFMTTLLLFVPPLMVSLVMASLLGYFLSRSFKAKESLLNGLLMLYAAPSFCVALLLSETHFPKWGSAYLVILLSLVPYYTH